MKNQQKMNFPTRSSNQGKADIKELLLEDYRYLQESFWKNETLGETRVNFFITLVTAVMAALVTLLTSFLQKGSEINDVPCFVFYVILFALILLLGVGIITLLRLIKRNTVTDGYKKDMDYIRSHFKDHFDSEKILEQYLPFRDKNKSKNYNRKPGGLLDLVNFFNAIIILGIVTVSLFLSGYNMCVLVIWGISIFIFLIIVHALCFYKNNLIEIARKLNYKKFNGTLTHAGGVVYHNGKYLIVTSTDGDKKVFPKGHIESGEGPKTAAIREVREETGVLAFPIFSLATTEFTFNNELILCKYYLMLKIGTTAKSEKRDDIWLTYDEAKKQLKIPDLLNLLELARIKVENLESNV
jgi:8-oxo-dGTP pyrophosphatase MutT (NUDIX family)